MASIRARRRKVDNNLGPSQLAKILEERYEKRAVSPLYKGKMLERTKPNQSQCYRREVLGTYKASQFGIARRKIATDVEFEKKYWQRLEGYYKSRVLEVWEAVLREAIKGRADMARLFLLRFDSEFLKPLQKPWPRAKNDEDESDQEMGPRPIPAFVSDISARIAKAQIEANNLKLPQAGLQQASLQQARLQQAQGETQDDPDPNRYRASYTREGREPGSAARTGDPKARE